MLGRIVFLYKEAFFLSKITSLSIKLSMPLNTQHGSFNLQSIIKEVEIVSKELNHFGAFAAL